MDPIQSDQGYHNYLLLSGALERADESTGRRALRVRSEPMGHGLVNTIGTLHVNRLQGKLADEDKFKQLAQWGLRDEAQGFVTNFDGMRSAIVHQWDRQPFLQKPPSDSERTCRGAVHKDRTPPQLAV